MPLSPLRRTLANDIVCLANENRTTPAVTLLVGGRAGAYYDPAGREGTASLVARVLDRGTTSRTASEIADDLDNRGAALSVVAGRHQLTVSATCLAEDFDTIFSMVADIVQHPVFEEREVETKRAELLTAILQDEDDPGAVAVDLAMARLYPQHPYGRRPRGSTDSVSRIAREQLIEFHRQRFTPEGATVVVVGDVEEDAVVRASTRAFGNWTRPRPSEPAVPSVAARIDRDV